MNKHPYRALVIWIAIIVALFNVYPTVGWMSLSEEAREARLEQWKVEDDERAKVRPTVFGDFWHGIKRWSQFDRERVINLGLDLQGGVHMVLSFNWEELPEENKKQLLDAGYTPNDIQDRIQQQVLQQIIRRVNDFEAKEPIIQTLGRNQVQIQLPGEKDIQRAKNLITKTAQLNFHIVAGPDETVQLFSRIRDAYPDQFIPFINRPLPGDPFTVPAENYFRVREVLEKAHADGVIPEDKVVLFSQPPKAYQPQQYQLYLLERSPLATGDGLTSAHATPDNENPPFWAIYFNFNAAAGADFAVATSMNIGRHMAIVVDESVISAPVIRDRIGSSGQITGSFEGLEARDLAIALNSGSMVVPVHEEMSRVVGASLGADAVHRGVMSSVTGVAIVGLFMMAYYLWAGVIAVLCLVLNGLFVVALMAYFNMTLTLPGIAGLILTIGMAVDANVLIFERIREELKLGHTLLSSVENGFSRVAVTILDANVTTLIAAAVLFQFGTGPIEGFAITLTIGVLTTVFTALVVCRGIVDLVVARKLIGHFKMLSVLPSQPKVAWLNYRKHAAVASIVLVVIGLGVFGARGKDMFGVDFTEGTTMEIVLASDEGIPVNDVRVALSRAGFSNPIVQEFGEGVGSDLNHFLIRVSEITEAGAPVEEEAAAPDAGEATEAAPAEEAAPETLSALATESVGMRIRNALAPLTTVQTAEGVSIEQEQTVGPAVGAQLRLDALQAILASFFFIIIYLSIRFELKFAVGAVVATIHDVLITIGVFAIVGLQIDMNVIAAILTLVGYSLNDTIVIFDRVREDLRVYRGKGYKFDEILNIAVNSTMARTILTSLTTLFVVVVLAIFGGNALRGFAIALCIGIVAGTYSTIFIASPVAYAWQQFQLKRAAAEEVRLAEATRRKKPAAKA